MKQMLIFLATGLFCLLLLGYGGNTAVSTPTPLAQLPTETASHTPSPNPTNTATSAPTASQPKPATPTMQSTSSATPSPTPIHFDIPPWVIDHTVNVFLAQHEAQRGNKIVVTVFNVNTAESFDMSIDEYVIPSWVWQDGELYLQIYYPWSTGRVNQDAYQELINLTTGEITTPPLNSLPGRAVKSPDGRFLVKELETADSPHSLALVNFETGKETELVDPFAGLFPDRIEFAWSPIANLVAVDRVRFVEDETALYGLRAESAFTIYDIDGKIIHQLQDIGQWGGSWSPMEPIRLLFPARFILGSQSPCIFDLNSETYTCLSEIALWAEEENVEFGLFQWSPDGTKVSFSYWDSIGGGFCYIELANKTIICPVTWGDLQIAEYLNRFDTGDGAHIFVTDLVSCEFKFDKSCTWCVGYKEIAQHQAPLQSQRIILLGK